MLTPIFIILLFSDHHLAHSIALFIFILASITDGVDGYYARKYDQVTPEGKFLDPLADKILLIGPMIWLVHENLVPLWAIWLIISRELLITSWRSEKTSGGPASILGKYKTTFQFASIILLLWPKSWGTNYSIYIINKIGYISLIKKKFPEIDTFQVSNLQNFPYDVLITKAFKK